MKTTSTNSFDFENQTVTGLNINADQGFNYLDNAHGELVGVSQPLVVGATDGADVNLLHILSELETQAFQAPAIEQDSAAGVEDTASTDGAAAGQRVAALTAESGVEMQIAPEIRVHAIFIDPPILFTGWLGVDAPQIEVEPILVDTAGAGDVDASAGLLETVTLTGEPEVIASIDSTDSHDGDLVAPEVDMAVIEIPVDAEPVVDAPIADTAIADASHDAPADDAVDAPFMETGIQIDPQVDTLEPLVCIGMPVFIDDGFVLTDGGLFELTFPEVFVAQPPVDGTDSNSTDASIEVPQVQVCEGYPAPKTVELNGEPEVISAKESQDTELNAVGIDAPVESTSTGDETVDVSAVEPAIDMLEPTICIGVPILLVDPVVLTDGGTFVFQFPEVFSFQPVIDSVEANGADTLPPELTTCGGDLIPEMVTINGEPEVIFSKDFVETESGAAEITLTGVAEGHPA